MKKKQSLRSILGGGVSKPSRSSPSSSPRRRTTTSSRPPSQSSGRNSRFEANPDVPDEVRPEDQADESDDQEKLPDLGLARTLVTDLALRDVPQAMLFIRRRMFSAMPSERTGMSAARIAEVLNFRAALPPVVSLAHLHAVLLSPSAIEREVAELVARGAVRRIAVRGRGESLVLVRDIEEWVSRSAGVDSAAARAFVEFVKSGLGGGSAPGASTLSCDHVESLIRAGFLTGNHSTDGGVVAEAVGSHAAAGKSNSGLALDTISRAPTGTLDAVGGRNASRLVGVGLVTTAPRTASSTLKQAYTANDVALSMPGYGSVLKLTSGAVAHLADLLRRTPFHERPEDTLRELWDGGLAASDAKRSRGESWGVLPGRTRKWRAFWGVSFEWVLEEAVGAGIVEVFETGSVGRGVRLL